MDMMNLQSGSEVFEIYLVMDSIIHHLLRLVNGEHPLKCWNRLHIK